MLRRLALGDHAIAWLRRCGVIAVAMAFVVAPVFAQPAAPERVVARAGETEVVLQWDPVDGARGYRVMRDNGSTNEEVGSPRDAFYIDRSITKGTTYTYTVLALDGGASAPSNAAEASPRDLTDDEFLDLVQVLAFDYFWYEAHPVTGLVKDRSTPGSASSIAAVGFGLTAYGIGVERGWITREEAVERTRRTLQFMLDLPQGPGTSGTAGYKGFFYHFLNMETGLRAGTNELSTIDTALLMAGVLYAGAYFDGDGEDEQAIRTLAQALYDRVDWRWSQAGGSGIRLGWNPEGGGQFIDIRWTGYNEAMLLYILAYGSTTFPAINDWSFWTNPYTIITAYGHQFISFPPLFGHQYSHAWVDFRGIQDTFIRQRSNFLGDDFDYFENSRRATLAQRDYAIDNPGNHPNYGENEWGFTASDDPITGYAAHGAPPAQNDNGTITPTAPGGSIAFAPEEATAALREMYRKYPNSLWSRYGFRDAYNLRRVWFAADFLGIDQGPFVLMIENLRTDHVWEVMDTVAPITLGLDRATFKPTPVANERADALETLRLVAAPNPSAGAVTLRFVLDAPAPARLAIYDLLGREVAVLLDGPQRAGDLATTWDAEGAAPGLYIARLTTQSRVVTAPIIRLGR